MSFSPLGLSYKNMLYYKLVLYLTNYFYFTGKRGEFLSISPSNKIFLLVSIVSQNLFTRTLTKDTPHSPDINFRTSRTMKVFC